VYFRVVEFGKLDALEGVNFNLAATRRVTPWPSTAGVHGKVLLGGTAWGIKEWVGDLYPAGTPAKAFLHAYSQQFGTLELNTTHYRIPDAETVLRWKRESEGRTQFCPKLPQVFSHSADLGLHRPDLLQFQRVISGLEAQLGPCFLQLPPTFAFDRLPLLERFLQQWPREIPLAVEFRHESWFTQESRMLEWGGMLQRLGKCCVITDVAGRRDVAHMVLAGTQVLVRWVGHAGHASDEQRLKNWASVLKEWMDMGMQEVHFFVHQPEPNAVRPAGNVLVQELEKLGVRVPALKSKATPPQNLTLFG
jgi:uncharacterized protein YecE (DUF72 family)